MEKKFKGIGRSIAILYRQSQLFFTAELKDLNILASEHPFVMSLLRHGSMSQEALSAKLLIDKAATARAIKSLESKGFVTRITDKDDKRSKLVIPTNKAESCKDRIIEVRDQWKQFLMEDFDESTQDLIIEALNKMAQKTRNADFLRINDEV